MIVLKDDNLVGLVAVADVPREEVRKLEYT